MEYELLLTEAVRDWTERAVPGDRAAADDAVEVALRAFAAGASVAESCEEARKFVASWVSHPASIPAEWEVYPSLA